VEVKDKVRFRSSLLFASLLGAVMLVTPLQSSDEKDLRGGASGAARLAELITEQEEALLGQKASALIEQQTPSVKGQPISIYFQELGDRLTSHAGQPGMNIRFHVLEDPKVEAFALPGGYVYAGRGLVSLCQNESELAGVLAHEIAHTVQRHGLQQVKATLGGATLPQDKVSIREVFSGHSKEAGLDADRLAVRILRRAGISPLGMTSLLGRIATLPADQQPSGSCYSALGARDRQARIKRILLASDTTLSSDSPRFQRERWRLSVDQLFQPSR
jgi:predicted Zn-dependent protease